MKEKVRALQERLVSYPAAYGLILAVGLLQGVNQIPGGCKGPVSSNPRRGKGSSFVEKREGKG